MTKGYENISSHPDIVLAQPYVELTFSNRGKVRRRATYTVPTQTAGGWLTVVTKGAGLKTQSITERITGENKAVLINALKASLVPYFLDEVTMVMRRLRPMEERDWHVTLHCFEGTDIAEWGMAAGLVTWEVDVQARDRVLEEQQNRSTMHEILRADEDAKEER